MFCFHLGGEGYANMPVQPFTGNQQSSNPQPLAQQLPGISSFAYNTTALVVQNLGTSVPLSSTQSQYNESSQYPSTMGTQQHIQYTNIGTQSSTTTLVGGQFIAAHTSQHLSTGQQFTTIGQHQESSISQQVNTQQSLATGQQTLLSLSNRQQTSSSRVAAILDQSQDILSYMDTLDSNPSQTSQDSNLQTLDSKQQIQGSNPQPTFSTSQQEASAASGLVTMSTQGAPVSSDVTSMPATLSGAETPTGHRGIDLFYLYLRHTLYVL